MAAIPAPSRKSRAPQPRPGSGTADGAVISEAVPLRGRGEQWQVGSEQWPMGTPAPSTVAREPCPR